MTPPVGFRRATALVCASFLFMAGLVFVLNSARYGLVGVLVGLVLTSTGTIASARLVRGSPGD